MLTKDDLTKELVRAVAHAAPCPHMGDDCDCATRNRAVVAALLRTLAAEPEGDLRYEPDGGIHRSRTLVALAAHIESGRTT